MGCLNRNILTWRTRWTIYSSNSTIFKDFLKSRILPTRPHRLAYCLLMFYCNLQSIIIMNKWVSWDLRKSAIIVIDCQLDSMIFIFVLPSICVVPGMRLSHPVQRHRNVRFCQSKNRGAIIRYNKPVGGWYVLDGTRFHVGLLYAYWLCPPPS